MGQVITFLLLLIILGFFFMRLRAINREAAERDEIEKKRREREKREIKEQELLDRLERLKNRDDLQIAKDAIHKDPKRAAKVVSRMMRGKE